MAKISRIVIPNISYHTTQRDICSMYIFFKPKIMSITQCKLHDVKIVSYC